MRATVELTEEQIRRLVWTSEWFASYGPGFLVPVMHEVLLALDDALTDIRNERDRAAAAEEI